MRQRFLVTALAVVSLLLAESANGADKAKVDARITEAISTLSKGGDSGGTAFKLIVEAISLAAPATKYSSDFGQSIEEAQRIFEAKSIVDPEGVAHLRKAYRLIHSGKDFEMPRAISSIEDAVQYAKVQLSAAKKDLESNDLDECVRKMVEIAVMIVTPMHRRSEP